MDFVSNIQFGPAPSPKETDPKLIIEIHTPNNGRWIVRINRSNFLQRFPELAQRWPNF